MKTLDLKLITDNNITIDKKRVPYKVENNVYTFIIDKLTHKLDITNETFLRENDDYSFFLDIKNKKSELFLKKENYLLQVKVEYAILLTNQKGFEIDYLIETQDEVNKLYLNLEGEL